LAFLLVVPFQAGWKYTSRFEHYTYYVTLVCIAISMVLLIAPSVHHRVLFRDRQKRYIVSLGNRLMITAMAFVGAGLTGRSGRSARLLDARHYPQIGRELAPRIEPLVVKVEMPRVAPRRAP
jgi:hypothetical protein